MGPCSGSGGGRPGWLWFSMLSVEMARHFGIGESLGRLGEDDDLYSFFLSLK